MDELINSLLKYNRLTKEDIELIKSRVQVKYLKKEIFFGSRQDSQGDRICQ